MAVREKSDPFLIEELWSRVNQNGELIVAEVTESLLGDSFDDLVAFIKGYQEDNWSCGSLYIRFNAHYKIARLKERVFQGPEVEWFPHSPPLNYDEVMFLIEKVGIKFFTEYEFDEWIKQCKQERFRA